MPEENTNDATPSAKQFVVARTVGSNKAVIPDKSLGNIVPPPPIVPWDPGDRFEPKGDCKLCKSVYKVEAEELYDRTMNIKRVHKLLTDDRQEDISYNAVRNHLKYHYQAQSDKHLMVEYGNEVGQWAHMQENQLEGMVRTMSMLEKECQKIGALSEGLCLTEYRKNMDTAGKLAALLLQYRKAVQEIQRENEGVTLVFQQIKVILGDEMKTVKTEEGKKVVGTILMKLKDQFGHMDIEE